MCNNGINGFPLKAIAERKENKDLKLYRIFIEDGRRHLINVGSEAVTNVCTNYSISFRLRNYRVASKSAFMIGLKLYCMLSSYRLNLRPNCRVAALRR